MTLIFLHVKNFYIENFDFWKLCNETIFLTQKKCLQCGRKHMCIQQARPAHAVRTHTDRRTHTHTHTQAIQRKLQVQNGTIINPRQENARHEKP